TAEVGHGVQMVAEVVAESNPEPGAGTWPAFATVGAIWGVNDSIDLDFGVKAGLNRPEVDVAALAAVVLKF
ncbi:MAG TPA: transporter, partial [Verrucomicrobiae bacterium]|nr:transporter [Verrucomicrobiae bacterium]